MQTIKSYACRYCGESKSLSPDCFKPEKRTKHGWDTVCRKCRNQETNQRRIKNHDKILAVEASRRNTKKYQEYQKTYRRENAEKLSERDKEKYRKNPEPYLRRSKEQKLRDPEGYKKYLKNWQQKNREYLNRYIVNRLHTDINFKLRHTLRSQLLKALNGLSKTNSAIKYLGCSIEFYKGYMEAKFRDGMSWENHGKVWHIDHIIPCNSFDLAIELNREKCFHYTNMQPLLVHENLSKGDKLPLTTSK